MTIALKEEELISVVVAVFNVEDYIEKCIESLCDQSYQSIEIILIDDGSTDASGRICDKMAATDSRISVVHKQNGGLSDARNVGLSIARGEYVSFVDGDDVVSPHIIEYLKDLIDRYSAQISICDCVHMQPKDEPFYAEETLEVVFDSRDALCEMLYQSSFLPAAWAKMFSLKLFERIRFPEKKLFEDVAIMGDLFLAADIIVYGNAKLYGYIHRENSITTRLFDTEDLYILDICDMYEQRFSPLGEKLKKAIIAYKTNCCLRVLFNLPDGAEYRSVMKGCRSYIRENEHNVIRDPRTRLKLKLGLVAAKFPSSLRKFVYSRTNRWD